ncbi:MAG TPA: hypothetical protein VH478_03080 [Trebonia sp.]|jgi:hypothetical protein|nr:hypothetical protein [Trebonia sp.]
MTTATSDEDTLIQVARDERRQHRSGKSMAGMLGVAIAFGAVGVALIAVPRLIGAILPLPFWLLGGFSLAVLTIVGVVAVALAGFFLLAALASSPAAAWGSAVAGACPRCGERKLRSDTVPGPASGGTIASGARGVVTLCDNCDYAIARVTRPGTAA